MPPFVLPLLPPQGLDQTIHVSVLLGLLLLLALTETFGWVFSGLVVPGYLASVLVVQPAAAATVLIEAVITFLAARFVSDVLSRTGVWSKPFGRDRFFLLILLSVLVRQACEIWLIEDVLRLVDARLGTDYHLAHQLSSIGLVLVPLTANMFWNLDLRRGLVQVAVPTLATYLLLQLVLLPHTNLSFSRLELMYEDVALDFLSSPKAYIILILGAFLGARANLLYGWDYGGILVPALLALGYYSPMRLVASAFEAFVLAWVVHRLVALPGVRSLNLEGPRRVALVFSVGFFLKFLIGWVMAAAYPAAKVTDLFGIGYLIPSLLAVKVLQKRDLARVLLPAFQVAAVAFVAAGAVSLALEQAAPAPAPAAESRPTPPAPSTVLTATPMGAMGLAQVRTRRGASSDESLVRSPIELSRYGRLWKAIEVWLRQSTAAPPSWLPARARELGLELRPTQGGWILLESAESLVELVGWDTAVLFPGAPGPVLEVPRPAEEGPAALAAALLCVRVACRAIIASGVDTHAAGLTSGDALASSRTPLAVANRQLRSTSVIQVRADVGVPPGKPVLHIKRRMPDFDLSRLPLLELRWEKPPGTDRAWDAHDRFATLRMHPHDLTGLLAAAAPGPPAPVPDTPLAVWLARSLAAVTPGATPGVPASQTELAFIEELVAEPVLREGAELTLTNALARLAGYQVTVLPDGAGPGEAVWVLAEPAARLGWGMLAVRRGAAEPVVVEVPRPLLESGTWRLGVEVWRSLRGAAVIVAGVDRNSDTTTLSSVATPFQAWHQACQRALGSRADPLILQVRGFGAERGVDADLVVALARPVRDVEALPPRLRQALVTPGPLAFPAARVRLHDGSQAMVELGAAGNPQLRLSARLWGVPSALAWLSTAAREPYQDSTFEREQRRFGAIGIQLARRSPAAELASLQAAPPAAAVPPQLASRFARAVELAQLYAGQENVQILRRLEDYATRSRLRFTAGFAGELGRSYLMLEARERGHVLRGVVVVGGWREPVELDAGPGVAPRVEAALLARPRLVAVHGRAP